MKEERWIERATRDRELEALLVAAIAKPADDTLIETVRYGATMEIEDNEELANFTSGSRKRGQLVRVRGPVPKALRRLEFERETMEPGKGWSKKLKALFWRAVAEEYRDRYSDAFLNRTAAALEAAIPWYEKHEPIEAAFMLGWRARVLGYASYLPDKFLPDVDRAIAILKTHAAKPETEYVIVLQLCEAIRRDSYDHPSLYELAVRGLELGDQLRTPRQLAELYGSAAGALVNATGVDLDPGPLARRLGTKAEPLTVAEAAWQRAMELEDGMFFGKFREDHVESHKFAYIQGLATIALRRGDVARASQLFDTLSPARSVYDRFQRTKSLVRLLRQNRVAREAQAKALAARLRTDFLEDPTLDNWDPVAAKDYFHDARYRLWNDGQRDAHEALVDAICERYGYPKMEPDEDDIESLRAMAAAEEEDAKRDAERAKEEEAMFGAMAEDLSDAERAAEERWAAKHADPHAKERQIADGVAERWRRDTRMALLFYPRMLRTDGAGFKFQISVNVPEYLLEDLLADPAIAAHLALLDTRLREALPGVLIEPEPLPTAIDTGAPPDTSLRRALSFARATSLLLRLGLDVDGAWAELATDDPAVAGQEASQSSNLSRARSFRDFERL